MKLVDELFAMYRDKITDDDDLDMITFAVLEHYDRKELMQIIHDMNEYELQYFIRLYLFESLKGKFKQMEEKKDYSQSESRFLH